MNKEEKIRVAEFDSYTKMIIKYFIFDTLPKLLDEKNTIPYPKFVFSHEAISMFEELIKSSQKKALANGKILYYFKGIGYNMIDISEDKARMIIDTLEQYNKEYTKLSGKDITLTNDMFDLYVNVADSKRFFNLLAQIVKPSKQNLLGTESLGSIWLRMTPTDFASDINVFLERQLDFLKTENNNENHIFNYNGQNDYDNFEDCLLSYSTIQNGDLFETNRCIIFRLSKDGKNYVFPQIHFAVREENGLGVCYIAGIQDDKAFEKDEEIATILATCKKSLRNKYVNFSFVLVLKFFIDLLCQQGIYDIKVPLLEIFNYPWHQNIGNQEERIFRRNYYDEKIAAIEADIKAGKEGAYIENYLEDKRVRDNFFGKEDIISKNKTERLVETFMVLESKYGNIEFLSDPLVQDDYLHIKINDERKVAR